MIESVTGTFGSNSNGSEVADSSAEVEGEEKCDDDSEYKAEVDEANLAEEEE